MFTRLLVPLDCSQLAEQALGPAAAIARASHAEIEIVYVRHVPTLGGFEDDLWGDAEAEVRAYIDTIAAELRSGAGVEAQATLLRGEPTDMICRRIWETDADLVVMSSHGRTGVSRAWLGSVADGIARHSSVPVLMLRPVAGRSRRDAAQHRFARVLVPLDGSALAADILVPATALAKCSGASLQLLRVVEPTPQIGIESGIPYAFPPSLIDDPATKRAEAEAKEQLADEARQLGEQTGLTVDWHVLVEPHAGPAIVDFARGHQSDVIALSTHGRGLSRFLVGSVADKVLRGSGLPMLVYRPLAVQAGVTDQRTRSASDGAALRPA